MIVRVRDTDLSLDALPECLGHLELLIDFSCDAMHAAAHPGEQAQGDTRLCGPCTGFGWSIGGLSVIFIHRGIFTNNRVADLVH